MAAYIKGNVYTRVRARLVTAAMHKNRDVTCGAYRSLVFRPTRA